MNIKSILVVFVSLTVFLTACSGLQSDKLPEDERVPDTAASGGTTEAQPPEERPGRVTQELCEGVSVDAEVIYPDLTEYDCFATKAPELTPEFLEDLFLTEDTSPRTVRQLEDPGEWPEYAGFFSIETEDGSFVRWMNGSLTYSAPPAGGDEKRAATIQEVLWDLGSTALFNDVELPGLSRAEAEAMVTEIWEKLDMIGTPKVTAFVGLDHNAIEESAGQLLDREDYQWTVQIGKLVELSGLTAENDGYFIRFDFSEDGLPLYGDADRRVEFAGDSMHVSDASLEAYIMGGKLTGFYLEGCFSRRDADVRQEKVIGLDAILEKVRAKHELEIINDPMTITKIYMEYVPFRETNVDFDLRPYWVLEYGYTVNGKFNSAGAERFNAVTGEDAAYGG